MKAATPIAQIVRTEIERGAQEERAQLSQKAVRHLDEYLSNYIANHSPESWIPAYGLMGRIYCVAETKVRAERTWEAITETYEGHHKTQDSENGPQYRADWLRLVLGFWRAQEDPEDQSIAALFRRAVFSSSP